MNTNVINKTKEEKILTEQKEKRNANTKYFLTENHGGIAAVYPYPVHFEEDGEWKEIDNTLQEENTEEAGYQNKASHFKVKFAKHGNSKKLVSVKLEEHKISWGLGAGGKKRCRSVSPERGRNRRRRNCHLPYLRRKSAFRRGRNAGIFSGE